MNLKELERTLPNGFHDARLSACNLDFAKQTVSLELLIHTGNPDGPAPEAYRLARVTLSGLGFFQIEPPDPSYPFDQAGPITVDSCEADQSHPLVAHLAAGVVMSRFFVYEWNAFVHVAARGAAIEWLDQVPVVAI